MKSEARRIAFLAATAGDVGIRLPGDRRCPGTSDALFLAFFVRALAFDLTADAGHGVEGAILIEQFPIAQLQASAGWGGTFQIHPAAKIFPQIDDEQPGTWLTESDRFKGLGDPDRRLGLRCQPPYGFAGQGRRSPRRLRRISRLIPARNFFSRVVDLAQIDTIEPHRAITHLPTGVADNRLLTAIGKSDVQSSQESRPSHRQLITQIQISPHAQRQRIIPAISQHDAQAILPLDQLPGDIIGAVKRPLGISRPTWIKNLIANSPPVHRGFVIAQSRDEKSGPLNSLRHLEFPAEKRGRIFAIEVLVLERVRLAVIQPLGLPVLRQQQTHIPGGRFAPCRNRLDLVPNPHFPITGGILCQRFPAIGNLDRVHRGDLATVPKIPLVSFQLTLTAGHQNLISGLHIAPSVGLHQPAQAGMSNINA